MNNKYKIGDIIGLRNMDGLDLLEIVDIYYPKDKDLSDVCLSTNHGQI